MSPRWLAAGVLCAVAIPWLPGLGGSLLADDWPLLAESLGPDNARVLLGRFITPLPEGLSPRFWRPLWYASLWVDAHAFGPRALPLQLVNLALHLLNVALLAALLLRLRLSRTLAWGAAACAGLSPLSHEAVGWVAARCGPMALCGVLVALLLVLRRDRWRWLAPLAALLGLWSKESAVVAWPLALTLLWAEGRSPRQCLRDAAPLLALAPAYFAARVAVLGTPGGGYAGLDVTPGIDQLSSRIETVITLFSLMRSQVVGGAGPLFALAALGLLAAGLVRQRPRRALLFLLTWVAVALLPVAAFVVTAEHAEVRFLHESGFALCAALAVSASSLGGKRAVAGLALLLALGLFLNLGPRRAAVQEAATAFEQVRQLAAQPHRVPLVLFALPDSHEHAYIGRNAFPSVLRPELGGPALGGPVSVRLDSVTGRCDLLQLLDRTGPPPAVRTLRWQNGVFAPALPGPADALCPPEARRY